MSDDEETEFRDFDDETNSDSEVSHIEESNQPYDNAYIEESYEEDDYIGTKLEYEYINNFHSENIHITYDEMYKLTLIKRDENGIIDDENHKTYPILTKYEKTKILGLRVSQINKGSDIYVNNNNYLEPSLIAEQELKEKKIPFIIKRPIPNGKCEYWNIKDLEIID